MLSFVGTKMLISEFYKFPIIDSLGVIATMVLVSVILSVLIPEKNSKK